MSASDNSAKRVASLGAAANKAIVQWLSDRYDEQKESLVSIAPDKFHVQQGRCVELKELIRRLESMGAGQ
jgi:hypothetical protein